MRRSSVFALLFIAVIAVSGCSSLKGLVGIVDGTDVTMSATVSKDGVVMGKFVYQCKIDQTTKEIAECKKVN